MSARRQIDIDGSITACDDSGHRLKIDCTGSNVTVDAHSVSSAVSVLLALRASGAIDRIDAKAIEALNDFEINLCVRGNRVGRAGAGIRASRLARTVTKIPLELHYLALLKACVTAL